MAKVTDSGLRLLEALRKDPCQTQDALAASLGVVRETVRQQLEALREAKLLRGRGYIVSDQIGHRFTRCVLISVNNKAIRDNALEKLLKETPLVVSYRLVTGRYDYIVLVDETDADIPFRTVIGNIRANDAVLTAETLDVVA